MNDKQPSNRLRRRDLKKLESEVFACWPYRTSRDCEITGAVRDVFDKWKRKPFMKNRIATADYWRGRFEALSFNVQQVAGECETLASDETLPKAERRTWRVIAARLRAAK